MYRSLCDRLLRNDVLLSLLVITVIQTDVVVNAWAEFQMLRGVGAGGGSPVTSSLTCRRRNNNLLLFGSRHHLQLPKHRMLRLYHSRLLDDDGDNDDIDYSSNILGHSNNDYHHSSKHNKNHQPINVPRISTANNNNNNTSTAALHDTDLFVNLLWESNNDYYIRENLFFFLNQGDYEDVEDLCRFDEAACEEQCELQEMYNNNANNINHPHNTFEQANVMDYLGIRRAEPLRIPRDWE